MFHRVKDIYNCNPENYTSMLKLAAINILLVIIFMTIFYLIAYLRKRVDTVDIAWGLGFVVIAVATALHRPSLGTKVVAILVTIWGLRLATHIALRSRGKKPDPRYQEITKKWKGNYWLRAYLSIFLTQGLLMLAVAAPIFFASGQPLYDWKILIYIGALIWIIGFVIEAIADQQLAVYLKNKKRPKLLNKGLWKYSRHPNYFGELTQWWGIGVIALSAERGYLGLIGPLLITYLIVFVSGIPPIEKRRSKDAVYRKYQKTTSPLIPWPPKK